MPETTLSLELLPLTSTPDSDYRRDLLLALEVYQQTARQLTLNRATDLQHCRDLIVDSSLSGAELTLELRQLTHAFLTGFRLFYLERFRVSTGRSRLKNLISKVFSSYPIEALKDREIIRLRERLSKSSYVEKRCLAETIQSQRAQLNEQAIEIETLRQGNEQLKISHAEMQTLNKKLSTQLEDATLSNLFFKQKIITLEDKVEEQSQLLEELRAYLKLNKTDEEKKEKKSHRFF